MSRSLQQMSDADSARLARQPFNYSPVGATRTASHPAGFHSMRHTAELGQSQQVFDRAAEALMTWRMHLGAGLRVTASADRAVEGAVVRCRLGPLPVPCRVVWVREEPDVRGFGYGTLPGHPESGEESFLVVRECDVVRLEISAYSRPGNLASRVAGPLGRGFQRVMIRRYAAALRREARSTGAA